MRKELIIGTILSLTVSTAYADKTRNINDVEIDHDEFTGKTSCRIEARISSEDAFGAGFTFIRTHEEGKGYNDPNSIFWSVDGDASRFNGDAHFLVDGERYQFPLLDSNTNVRSGTYIDRAVYEIDSEMYVRLASASEVRVRLNGRRSVVAEFGPEALGAAAAFKSECLDDFM